MYADYLIVGAGFTGSVLAERLASQANQRVFVIERRDHIGGDAYDYRNEHGHLVHRYGPHVFHSDNPRVFEYLTQFTKWRNYTHRAKANVDGKLIPIPFNLESLYALFPSKQASRMELLLKAYYGAEKSVPILRLRKCKYNELRELGNYVHAKIYEGYTKKMWGLYPDELDTGVTARVPVWITWKDDYHHTRYTGVPDLGYTNLFNKMLSHKLITVLKNTDYREVKNVIRHKFLIYTGPIDEFFNHKYGHLPYISMRFEAKTIAKEWYQSVAQINFPGEESYIRMTEQKHITGQIDRQTTIVAEYPEIYRHGQNQPHYPVLTDTNRELHRKYLEEAAKLKNTIFVGRSADYKYYNIAQSVSRALSLFDQMQFSVNLKCTLKTRNRQEPFVAPV